jgi:hypothetical protein
MVKKKGTGWISRLKVEISLMTGRGLLFELAAAVKINAIT